MKHVFSMRSSYLQFGRVQQCAVVGLIAGFLLSSCSSLSESNTTDSNQYSPKSFSEQYPDSPGYRVLEAKEPLIISGFRRVELDSDSLVYVAHNAAIESFDNWQLLVPTIDYNNRQGRLTPAESNQLQRLAIQAARNQVYESGLELVVDPSPCTLTAQLMIADLRLFKTGRPSSQLNYAKSLGSYEAIVEIREAESKALVVFMVSHVDMGGGTTKSGSPNMNRFVYSIADTVDKLPSIFNVLELDNSKISAREEVGCEGAIGTKWKQLIDQEKFGLPGRS